LRKDYEHSEKLNHEAIMQNKDQIIKQLTIKLQDSTKIIQELKTKNKKLVDRYQDLDHAQAQKSEEQIAMVMQKEKENIEKVKSMMQSRIE